MKELLSIQEFSLFSGVEASTLRYWDNIGLFTPAERDPLNNYRYYSPQQIIAVNFIKVMSSLNVPLKTIGEMQQERNPAKIAELIEQQQKLLNIEMHRLRECYSIIHTRQELIQFGMLLEDGFRIVDGKRINKTNPPENATQVDETKISVLYSEDRPFILGPPNEWVAGEAFYKPFKNFCAQAAELRINLNFPIGAYHNSMEDFIEAPGCPQHFFSTDPMGNRKQPAGNYLVGFTRGYYGEMGDVAARMAAYATENCLKIFGPVYVIYLHDEICLKDPSQYLVQVSVAVAEQGC